MTTVSFSKQSDDLRSQNFTACYRCNMMCRDSDMDFHCFYQCLARPLPGIVSPPLGVCPHCNKSPSLAKMQFHINEECEILTMKCPFCNLRKHNLIEHLKTSHSEKQHLQEYINSQLPSNPYAPTPNEQFDYKIMLNNVKLDFAHNVLPISYENNLNQNSVLLTNLNNSKSKLSNSEIIPDIQSNKKTGINFVDGLPTSKGLKSLPPENSRYKYHLQINGNRYLGVENPNNVNMQVVCPHCHILFNLKKIFFHFYSLRYKCVFCNEFSIDFDCMLDHLYNCPIMPRPTLNGKFTTTRCLFCLRDILTTNMATHYAQFHCWCNPECLFCNENLYKDHLNDCIKKRILSDSEKLNKIDNLEVIYANPTINQIFNLSSKLSFNSEIYEENTVEKLMNVWQEQMNPQDSDIKLHCSRCSLQFSLNKIADHFLTHKPILLDCLLCNHNVLLTNLFNHSDICILQTLKFNNDIASSDIKSKCPICNKHFDTSELKNHIASIHMGLSRIIQCPQCDRQVRLFQVFQHIEYCVKIEFMSKSFKSSASSRIEMQSEKHTISSPRENNKNSPKRNRRQSQSTKSISINKKNNSTKIMISSTNRKKIKIRNYQKKSGSVNSQALNAICPFCSKYFRNNNLFSHIYSHSNSIYLCPICKKNFKLSFLKKHIEECLKTSICSVPDGEFYRCNLCKIILTNIDFDHIASHIEVCCPICSQIYSFLKLNQHLFSCISNNISNDINSTVLTSRTSSPNNDKLLIDVLALQSPLNSLSEDSDHFDLVGAWCTPEPDTSLCETSNWTQELQFDVFISEDEKLLVSSSTTQLCN